MFKYTCKYTTCKYTISILLGTKLAHFLVSMAVVNFEYTTSLHQCFSLYCDYTKSELIGILIV